MTYCSFNSFVHHLVIVVLYGIEESQIASRLSFAFILFEGYHISLTDFIELSLFPQSVSSLIAGFTHSIASSHFFSSSSRLAPKSVRTRSISG
jgi:hypothetical protein